MKVLVLGASGFLGSHLSSALLQAGHEVVGTSRAGGLLSLPDGQELQTQAVDILEEDVVRKSAEGCEAAFFCAGIVAREKDAAERLQKIHVDGTAIALKALQSAGVPRVVYVSTSGTLAVSKNSGDIADEASPTPLEHIGGWPYYRTKLYGEKVALSMNCPEFEVICVHPSLLLGPGDIRESSTGDVRRFLEKSISATPAGGLAFVDVRDAAQGLIAALERGNAGERYLLNSANMTVKAFFGRLARMTGVSAPLFSLPRQTGVALGIFDLYESALKRIGGSSPVERESVELGQYYWYCSSEKAESQLGFQPRDPGDTIRDTVADLIERQVVAPLEGFRQFSHARTSDD
ncbi:MAG: NAD-dependent epimerase/dehydratase family protein [Polyangiaceae bacterium]|nr:NAD-dependent epimerase/dehydratase family protein [Polyangiaceae bacterium]